MIQLVRKELKFMEQSKKITLPIKVIIIGSIFGLIVAGIGGIKQLNANKINENRRQAALKASEEAVEKANARLIEIEKEYNEVKNNYNSKSAECDAIVAGSDGWFEKSNKCQREKQELQSQLWDLESEDSAIKNKDYTGYYQTVKPMSYQIFYIIGASIVGLSLLGAFIIYLVKGKKNY